MVRTSDLFERPMSSEKVPSRIVTHKLQEAVLTSRGTVFDASPGDRLIELLTSKHYLDHEGGGVEDGPI